MDVIVDTNALSALAENQPALLREFSPDREIGIPVVVLGEFRFGIAQSRRRSEYEKWLNRVLAASIPVVIDEQTAVTYAEIRVQLKLAGTPIPSNDVWIAALCLQHGSPVLSRDQHFDRVTGIRRIAW
jgi:tRNA(fMet)-specific endonuclease VapC